MVVRRRMGDVARFFSWNALSIDVVTKRGENVPSGGDGGGREERDR